MSAGALCFQCAACRDNIRFFVEMAILGIQIPYRLVSFCPVRLTLRLSCRACPGTALAGLALGCLMSTCSSFTENLEVELGWICLDNLGSYAGDTGGSSLPLPTLVDYRHGRTTAHTKHFSGGTAAAMPANAFTMEAESRQRGVGELPQQLSEALWGISASPQAGGASPEHQRCAVPGTPWLGSLGPHGHNRFASPGPGSCSCAAPALLRAPTDSAPT